MGKYGFTLRFLLGLTAVMCASLALLRYPTHFNVVAMFSITLAALGAAAIGAVTSRGALQAFCIGFVIAGGIHLVFGFTGWFNKGTSQALLSNYVLDQLAPSLGYPMPAFDYDDRTLSMAVGNWTPGSEPERFFKYIAIGQSLITLILAMVGGWLGAHFHARRSDANVRAREALGEDQS